MRSKRKGSGRHVTKNKFKKYPPIRIKYCSQRGFSFNILYNFIIILYILFCVYLFFMPLFIPNRSLIYRKKVLLQFKSTITAILDSNFNPTLMILFHLIKKSKTNYTRQATKQNQQEQNKFQNQQKSNQNQQKYNRNLQKLTTQKPKINLKFNKTEPIPF